MKDNGGGTRLWRCGGLWRTTGRGDPPQTARTGGAVESRRGGRGQGQDVALGPGGQRRPSQTAVVGREGAGAVSRAASGTFALVGPTPSQRYWDAFRDRIGRSVMGRKLRVRDGWSNRAVSTRPARRPLGSVPDDISGFRPHNPPLPGRFTGPPLRDPGSRSVGARPNPAGVTPGRRSSCETRSSFLLRDPVVVPPAGLAFGLTARIGTTLSELQG